MKPCILFIDDEPMVLEGLRALLRRRRGDWTMRFAEGGEEALALLARESFDVIVSDMQMPGMDGVELLTRIRSVHPDGVRIILSGQADAEQVSRSIMVSHQYLTKPCDPTRLEDTLDRICALREIMPRSGLRARIGGLACLPATPGVCRDIESALAAGGSVTEVAAICSRDAAVAAKLFQLSNSGILSLPREIDSVKEAVEAIGLPTLGALVTEHGVFEGPEPAEISPCRIDLQAEVPPFDAASSDILRHVGKLVLAAVEPDRAASAWESARRTGRSVLAEERRIVGAGHAEAGAYLLGLWGLPPHLVAAVADGHGIDGADVAAHVDDLAARPSATRR